MWRKAVADLGEVAATVAAHGARLDGHDTQIVDGKTRMATIEDEHRKAVGGIYKQMWSIVMMVLAGMAVVIWDVVMNRVVIK